MVAPSETFTADCAWVSDVTVEASTGQCAQFALGDIQPSAVLGCMHQVRPADETQGFGRSEGRVQRGQCVRVEIVEDQRDHLCGREARLINQTLHLPSPSQGRLGRRHRGLAPTSQRFRKHPHVTRHPDGHTPSRSVVAGQQRGPRLRDQLFELFVPADHWISRGIRLLIDLEDLLHLTDQGRVLFRRDAPHRSAPRLQIVF